MLVGELMHICTLLEHLKENNTTEGCLLFQLALIYIVYQSV